MFPVGTGTGYVVALTYGPEAQWVRNILAAGGAALETRERTWRLTGPRLVQDPSLRLVPPFVRLPLRLLGVTDFLDLSVKQDSPRPARR